MGGICMGSNSFEVSQADCPGGTKKQVHVTSIDVQYGGKGENTRKKIASMFGTHCLEVNSMHVQP